jgi:hypothetical protein
VQERLDAAVHCLDLVKVCLGDLPGADLAGKDGWTSSARKTLTRSSAWEVGGMSSPATSDTVATAARITSSCGASVSVSSAVSRMRANSPSLATSAAVIATDVLLSPTAWAPCRGQRLTIPAPWPGPAPAADLTPL